MKLRKIHIEILSILTILLFGLYLWTVPIRYSPLPYGEVDSASHYALADYTSSKDAIITTLPPYIDIRYGIDNAFRPHSLWYAPHYHLNLAVMQILTQEQTVTFYLGTAIFNLFPLLAIFLLLRKKLGYWIATISSFFLIFHVEFIT